MLLEAVCPNGHRLHVPPEHAGMKLRCPACNAVFQLDGVPPAPSGTNLSPAPATSLANAAPPAPAAPTSTEPAAPTRWSANEGALAPAAATAPAAAPQAAARPAPSAPVQQPQPPAPQPLRRARSWQISIPLLLRSAVVGGLMLVVTARGCDGLTSKNVIRLQSAVDLGQRDFEEEREQSIADAQAMLEKPGLSSALKIEYQKQLDKAQEEFDKRRRELQQGEWRVAANDAKRAVAESRSAAYWHEWLFFVGTLLLAVGLSTTALVGQGAERWVGLALAAILVFSLFIGGTAWLAAKL